MKLEKLCRSRLTVHKDLVVESAPGESEAVFGPLLSHEVVPNKPILSLLVGRAGGVAL